MISKVELKSIPAIYNFPFTFSALAIIHLYAHIVSPVLLFSQKVLCDRERYSSTFGFILANTTFDNIFLITDCKITVLNLSLALLFYLAFVVVQEVRSLYLYQGYYLYNYSKYL